MMKERKFILCVIVVVLLVTLAGCNRQPVLNDVQAVNEEKISIINNDKHEDITKDLIALVENDEELKNLLEKSIQEAKDLNPDPDTNPVVDLESYYDFIDFCYKCLPWQICPSERYISLYDKINQGMGCLYFVCDQPLEELENKGYYHNSLMYHEPFRTWFTKFLKVSGEELSKETSWCDEYYQNALQNKDFHLDDDTYEDPGNWHSFNDFFARRLKEASVRPITLSDDDSVVVAPADSCPQGVWDIDGNNKIVNTNENEHEGIVIKTGKLTDVSVLLGDSQYANSFKNGKMTHTFLDINDYHRYHFPISGTIKEVLLIPQDDAPGGVITWDKESECYVEYYSETFGWQSIETRGIVIVETDNGGLVAIVPVGMCQVSSVNFEDNVTVGTKVNKGDPLGYFLFGGSDIVMLFSEDLEFSLTTNTEHLLMGEKYGSIKSE